jgi:transposase
MGKRYQISAEQVTEIEAARRKNSNKNVERRLHALLLYAQGVRREEIELRTGVKFNYMPALVTKYRDGGLPAIVENHCGGNNRLLTFAEEEALLAPFIAQAEAGQIVETSAILRAYEAKLGRTFENDHGRIYRVLKRHKWRMVMPRSKHPDKAIEEEIALAKNKILCASTDL